MNYGIIKKVDIADGLGVRVSLFVSGCRVHCKHCQNQITWDFNFGKPFTKETEDEIIKDLAPEFIQGLTVLGGEPFEPENQEALVNFLERVKNTYPNKNIWCYTGYIYDKDLLPKDGKKHTPFTNRMLACIDILVDGPFVESLKDLTLNYRGSSNQRIIDLTNNRLLKL